MRQATFYPAIVMVLAFCFGTAAPARAKEDLPETLKKIYGEVKEMGARPGEDFIKGEFFIGAPDDDDTNKDISVFILIQNTGGAEKMKIQVTYMERTKENVRIKIAKETKNIICAVAGGAVRIQHSDYIERELPKLAVEILQAIRDKKKLLKDRATCFSELALLSCPKAFLQGGSPVP